MHRPSAWPSSGNSAKVHTNTSRWSRQCIAPSMIALALSLRLKRTRALAVAGACGLSGSVVLSSAVHSLVEWTASLLSGFAGLRWRRSLTASEQMVVVRERDVAGEALDTAVRHRPDIRIAALEGLETPSAGFGIAVVVLHHDRDDLACALGERVVRLFRIGEAVDDEGGALREPPAPQPLPGGGIGIDMLDSYVAYGIVAGEVNRRMMVLPTAIAFRERYLAGVLRSECAACSADRRAHGDANCQFADHFPSSSAEIELQPW